MGAEEARPVLLARQGAQVVLADILDAEGAQTINTLEVAGGEAVSVHTDVTHEVDWQNAVQVAVSRFDKLDILVNSAGLSSTSASDPLDTAG